MKVLSLISAILFIIVGRDIYLEGSIILLSASVIAEAIEDIKISIVHYNGMKWNPEEAYDDDWRNEEKVADVVINTKQPIETK